MNSEVREKKAEIPVSPELRAWLKGRGVKLGQFADYIGCRQSAVTTGLQKGFTTEQCMRIELLTSMPAWKFTTRPDVARLLQLYGVRPRLRGRNAK